MKKTTLLQSLLATTVLFSSLAHASENYIQTQNYQLPEGITALHCQMKITFSNNIVLGPIPVTIENKPTYTDNAVVAYLCGKTTCEWLHTSITDCDQHAVLVDPASVALTNFTYNYTTEKYVATPDTMLFKFKIEA